MDIFSFLLTPIITIGFIPISPLSLLFIGFIIYILISWIAKKIDHKINKQLEKETENENDEQDDANPEMEKIIYVCNLCKGKFDEESDLIEHDGKMLCRDCRMSEVVKEENKEETKNEEKIEKEKTEPDIFKSEFEVKHD